MTNLYLQDYKQRPFQDDKVLKATALIYLEEALFNEEYEKCQDLIKEVKKFGAKPLEIKYVLQGTVQRLNGRTKLEEKLNIKGKRF